MQFWFFDDFSLHLIDEFFEDGLIESSNADDLFVELDARIIFFVKPFTTLSPLDIS